MSVGIIAGTKPAQNDEPGQRDHGSLLSKNRCTC